MVKQVFGALLALWIVAAILIPSLHAEQKRVVKFTGSHVAAVASTNVLSSTYTPSPLVASVQITVAVATTGATVSWNQDGAPLALNGTTGALTADLWYAFELGVTPGASYSLTFDTGTIAFYTVTEVYR